MVDGYYAKEIAPYELKIWLTTRQLLQNVFHDIGPCWWFMVMIIFQITETDPTDHNVYHVYHKEK